MRCQNLLDVVTLSGLPRVSEQHILGIDSTIHAHALNDEPQASQDEATDIEDFLDCTSQFPEDISETIRCYTSCPSLLDCSIASPTIHYPEEYAIAEPLYERIAYFSMMELSRTSPTRVDKYFLIFAHNSSCISCIRDSLFISSFRLAYRFLRLRRPRRLSCFARGVAPSAAVSMQWCSSVNVLTYGISTLEVVSSPRAIPSMEERRVKDAVTTSPGVDRLSFGMTG